MNERAAAKGRQGVGAHGRSEAVRAAIALVQRRAPRFAELWFTELSGRPRRIACEGKTVDERLFASGMTLDGPSTGPEWTGLVTIMPDPEAIFVDPVASVPTIAILGELVGDSVLEGRSVLRRAERRLLESGVATSCRIGCEQEFFVMDPASGRPVPEEIVWEVIRSQAAALEEAGFVLGDAFRFGPSEGQGRVQMFSQPALRTADQVVFYRYLLRTLVRRRGLVPTFLPKPFPGPGSASMPLHLALWKDDTNVFHDAGGWALTSAVGRWFAGGVLEHAAALMGFAAPTTNSYRRFVPGGAAPTDLVLSAESPSAALRVPARSASPGARRLKLRLPDGTANPYLCFAAVLMAGLDGIERRLDPPLDGAASHRLPYSLEEALEALERDSAFLFAGDVFSPELIRGWVDDRCRRQVQPMRAVPHPAELAAEES